jgi:RNA polymerase sigma-70 factor, ECF subfamily
MSVQAADDVYLAHRDALFGLADRSDVDNPRAYLFSVTARLSLDLLKSAQRTRVSYVGSWLPEPLVTPYDDRDDPATVVERTDTISLAFLYLLEQLSAQERAVFVLRTAFDFPHAHIADMLELSPDNVRQLFRRAQQRLGADGAPRNVPDPVRRRELVERFLAAAATGEVEPFAALLAEDVQLVADGGGNAAAVRVPLLGRLRVARFLRGLVRRATPEMRFDVVRANGAPAVLVHTPSEVIGVYVLDIDDAAGVVRGIHAIRNPDKLARLLP